MPRRASWERVLPDVGWYLGFRPRLRYASRQTGGSAPIGTASNCGGSTMFVLLYLHILAMFTAVTVVMGAGILVLIGARGGERSVVAAITSLPIPRLAGPLYAVGGLFGLATAFVFGYNLRAPWLIIAYVLFAILTVVGIRVSGPIFERTHAV